MSVPPLGAFWGHFEPELEPFWRPKVRKSGPKSIPETNRFLDLDLFWFWMIVGRFVRPNTFKNPLFFSMVSWSSRFFTKFTIGINKVRFLDLKIAQNRSFWEQIRLLKSIRILDQKKEGPKSRNVSPKARWLPLGRAFLEPRGPWEGQYQKKR